MKRFTLVLTLCLTPCLFYSLSKAQEEPVWKYITSVIDTKTGETIAFLARDCYRYTDAESAKYPKLSIKESGTPAVKEVVAEFDCKRRVSRIRIFIYTDGAEQKAKDIDWTEAVPDSAGEALLNYACRDRGEKKWNWPKTSKPARLRQD